MIPVELASLLAGFPTPGSEEQAFPLMTVDEAGHPHSLMLSRAELAVHEAELLAVSRGRTSDANLLRSGRATLLAIEGATFHSLKLRLTHRVAVDGFFGYRFRAAAHKSDSVGLRLTPILFRTTPELAILEQWERTRRLLIDLHRPAATPATDTSDERR